MQVLNIFLVPKKFLEYLKMVDITGDTTVHTIKIQFYFYENLLYSAINI